jgi:MYXO-CTERM domain-containing protein
VSNEDTFLITPAQFGNPPNPPAATPEPGAWAVLAVGALALIARRGDA